MSADVFHNLQLHLAYQLPLDAFDCFLFERTRDGFAVAEPLVMLARPVNALALPTFRLNRAQAQQFIDALWSAGIRPSAGSGSAGSLAATERHLEDMRKIALSLLDDVAIEVKPLRSIDT